MSVNLTNRDLLTLLDLDYSEIRFILDLAAELKRAKYAGHEIQQLKGKNIALIFEKPSTRTRCAFEVAMYDQGGHVTTIDTTNSQLGHKESLKDTVRILNKLYDGIEYRGFQQATLEELAHHAQIPVWNGLTDTFHPTQILADLMTMEEISGQPLNQLSFCYLGDTRFNIGNSLLIGGTKMGMDVRLCAPEALWPDAKLVAKMRDLAKSSGARLSLEPDPLRAVKYADFLYTDVWLSMGEPIEMWAARIKQLLPYQVNRSLLEATGKAHTKFMHCLPALHQLGTTLSCEIYERFGLSECEVTNEVFESEASIVFSQAENRLHTIKALLIATLT